MLVPKGEQSQHVNLRKSSLEILYRASGRNPKAQSAGQIDAEDQTDLHSIGCLRLFEGAVLDGSNAKRTTEKADQVSSRVGSPSLQHHTSSTTLTARV